jgi:adenylosuccinate lyase
MSVHPIEDRYGRKEVRRIFEEENKLQRVLDVEAALSRAHAAVGNIPKKDADAISTKASIKYVKVARVKEIEAEIHHDVMAIVKALSEQCEGDAGRYVHLGATSNDITDTALALQFKEYIAFLLEDLDRFKKALLKQAEAHKRTVCIGRTHAQHSIPTTYGLKFGIYACEVQRHIDRINECKERLLVGQMTGAVGTQASFGEKGIKIQELIMKDLGLGSVMVSNQVIQRDRHAEFMLDLALIAETLNKIATEIRNLQRTEICEVSEGFREKQVGSSTMPHKRNPIYAERVCGLSRVIKANAIVSLDNIPLWHERDLTNSSPERIIFPEACILTDYILTTSINLINDLVFDYKAIDRNLNMSRGLIMAENLMMTLVGKGMGRQEAHELLRTIAMESHDKEKPFRELLVKNKEISRYLKEKEIDAALDPKNYIGTAVLQVEKVIKELA